MTEHDTGVLATQISHLAEQVSDLNAGMRHELRELRALMHGNAQVADRRLSELERYVAGEQGKERARLEFERQQQLAAQQALAETAAEPERILSPIIVPGLLKIALGLVALAGAALGGASLPH